MGSLFQATSIRDTVEGKLAGEINLLKHKTKVTELENEEKTFLTDTKHLVCYRSRAIFESSESISCGRSTLSNDEIDIL